MNASRRRQLKFLSLGLACGALPVRAFAAERDKSLAVNLLGFSLGIHVPAVAGVVDLLPASRPLAREEGERDALRGHQPGD